MRILAIGSTIKKTLFGVFRALRVNDDGEIEIGNWPADTYVNDPIATVENGADDTYDYEVDMRGWASLSLDLILNSGSGSVTVTILAAMEQTVLEYHDVTDDAFGVASITSSAWLLDDNNYFKHWDRVIVRVVANTGGADDADWTILQHKEKV